MTLAGGLNLHPAVHGSPPVLSVQRCRRLLGDEANHLTDQEIEHIRDAMYVFADVTISAHQIKHEKKDNDTDRKAAECPSATRSTRCRSLTR